MVFNKDIEYYFGRLNLISWIPKKEKPAFIHNILLSNVSLEEKDAIWAFFDINKINYNDEDYIFGILVKYKPEFETEIADEISKTLKTAKIPTKTISRNEFILHLKTGIIAYHPFDKRHNCHQFKKKFSTLIEKGSNQMISDAEIQSVDDETEILKELKRFDKITNINIVLHPSNPNNRERWKKTDEKLRRMKVQKFKEMYIGDNILLDEQDDTYGNITMALDGYGKADIKGYVDDKPYTVSTAKLPIKDKAPKENYQLIIKILSKTFKEIFERFDKNENP